MATHAEHVALLEFRKNTAFQLGGDQAESFNDVVTIGPRKEMNATFPISRATGFPRPPKDHLIELPLTQAGGFLLLMLMPKDLGFEVEKFKGGHSTINVYAPLLGAIVDPASADFRKSIFKQFIHGDVLLMRSDGKKLQPMQVFALTNYCLLKVQRAFIYMIKKEAEGTTVDRKAILGEFLTPGKFAEYFEERKREGMRSQPKAWDVECPVKLDYANEGSAGV